MSTWTKTQNLTSIRNLILKRLEAFHFVKLNILSLCHISQEIIKLMYRPVVPGGAMAPPDFGRLWLHITTGTPGFSDLPTALIYLVLQLLLSRRRWVYNFQVFFRPLKTKQNNLMEVSRQWTKLLFLSLFLCDNYVPKWWVEQWVDLVVYEQI